jgi:hypothetical protein
MDGWMDGRESRVKDCLQQSKMTQQMTIYHNDRYINFIHILNEINVIYVLGENTFISYSTKLVSNKVGQVRLISWPNTLVEMGGMMDLVDSALLKNLSSVDNLTI